MLKENTGSATDETTRKRNSHTEYTCCLDFIGNDAAHEVGVCAVQVVHQTEQRFLDKEGNKTRQRLKRIIFEIPMR